MRPLSPPVRTCRPIAGGHRRRGRPDRLRDPRPLGAQARGPAGQGPVARPGRHQDHHTRRQGHHHRPLADLQSQDARAVQAARGAGQGRPDPGHARPLRPLRRCAGAREDAQRAGLCAGRHEPDRRGPGHPAHRTRAANGQGRHHHAVRPHRPEDHRGACRAFVGAGLEEPGHRQGRGASGWRAGRLHHRARERPSRSGTWATPRCSATCG